MRPRAVMWPLKSERPGRRACQVPNWCKHNMLLHGHGLALRPRRLGLPLRQIRSATSSMCSGWACWTVRQSLSHPLPPLIVEVVNALPKSGCMLVEVFTDVPGFVSRGWRFGHGAIYRSSIFCGLLTSRHFLAARNDAWPLLSANQCHHRYGMISPNSNSLIPNISPCGSSCHSSSPLAYLTILFSLALLVPRFQLAVVMLVLAFESRTLACSGGLKCRCRF